MLRKDTMAEEEQSAVESVNVLSVDASKSELGSSVITHDNRLDSTQILASQASSLAEDEVVIAPLQNNDSAEPLSAPEVPVDVSADILLARPSVTAVFENGTNQVGIAVDASRGDDAAVQTFAGSTVEPSLEGLPDNFAEAPDGVREPSPLAGSRQFTVESTDESALHRPESDPAALVALVHKSRTGPGPYSSSRIGVETGQYSTVLHTRKDQALGDGEGEGERAGSVQIPQLHPAQNEFAHRMADLDVPAADSPFEDEGEGSIPGTGQDGPTGASPAAGYPIRPVEHATHEPSSDDYDDLPPFRNDLSPAASSATSSPSKFSTSSPHHAVQPFQLSLAGRASYDQISGQAEQGQGVVGGQYLPSGMHGAGSGDSDGYGYEYGYGYEATGMSTRSPGEPPSSYSVPSLAIGQSLDEGLSRQLRPLPTDDEIIAEVLAQAVAQKRAAAAASYHGGMQSYKYHTENRATRVVGDGLDTSLTGQAQEHVRAEQRLALQNEHKDGRHLRVLEREARAIEAELLGLDALPQAEITSRKNPTPGHRGASNMMAMRKVEQAAPQILRPLESVLRAHSRALRVLFTAFAHTQKKTDRGGTFDAYAAHAPVLNKSEWLRCCRFLGLLSPGLGAHTSRAFSSALSNDNALLATLTSTGGTSEYSSRLPADPMIQSAPLHFAKSDAEALFGEMLRATIVLPAVALAAADMSPMKGTLGDALPEHFAATAATRRGVAPSHSYSGAQAASAQAATMLSTFALNNTSPARPAHVLDEPRFIEALARAAVITITRHPVLAELYPGDGDKVHAVFTRCGLAQGHELNRRLREEHMRDASAHGGHKVMAPRPGNMNNMEGSPISMMPAGFPVSSGFIMEANREARRAVRIEAAHRSKGRHVQAQEVVLSDGGLSGGNGPTESGRWPAASDSLHGGMDSLEQGSTWESSRLTPFSFPAPQMHEAEPNVVLSPARAAQYAYTEERVGISNKPVRRGGVGVATMLSTLNGGQLEGAYVNLPMASPSRAAHLLPLSVPPVGLLPHAHGGSKESVQQTDNGTGYTRPGQHPSPSLGLHRSGASIPRPGGLLSSTLDLQLSSPHKVPVGAGLSPVGMNGSNFPQQQIRMQMAMPVQAHPGRQASGPSPNAHSRSLPPMHVRSPVSGTSPQAGSPGRSGKHTVYPSPSPTGVAPEAPLTESRMRVIMREERAVEELSISKATPRQMASLMECAGVVGTSE